MCGIAGIFNRERVSSDNRSIIEKMTTAMVHRGPDDYGYYINNEVAFGHSRLSIIDIAAGHQPIFNEDNSLCIVFNGEIFNYIELREDLLKKGHQFRTHSDTEVIIHLYEQYGLDFLAQLNGQFAIAIWDIKEKKLLLARDRVGICPLFYSLTSSGTLLFASEIKSILQHPEVTPEFDAAGINQIFNFWVSIPPRTAFKNICELAPGEFMVISNNNIHKKAYWTFQHPDADSYENHPLEYYKEGLRDILHDATEIRLRADVPVASYLSGGIDSSVISALVKKHHNNNLVTFSVAFKDAEFDERPYQIEMANHLKTDHHIIEVDNNTIGTAFADAIKFGEKPIFRTAPSPLLLLSGFVRQNNIKVVLTGEGSDEILGGYNIFKETMIRRFWAKHPESQKRPRLLSKLYPYISRDPRTFGFWKLFFRKSLTDVNNNYYSHLIRWGNTGQIRSLFHDDFFGADDESALYPELERYADSAMSSWHPLSKAMYLESRLFLPGYLLSSQGDRMLMGNSVEGRFPFLDHRVIEFCSKIPPHYKLHGLNEKFLLKKTFEDILPPSITNRPKQPYRAPVKACFLSENKNLSSSMLDPQCIKKYGIFNADTVEKLLGKINSADSSKASERDYMSLVGIVSMQLLHHHFIGK